MNAFEAGDRLGVERTATASGRACAIGKNRSSSWSRVAGCLFALPLCAPCANAADDPHAKELVLHLPFPAGKAFVCEQGDDGDDDAKELDTNAFDFPMSIGSPVVAAADGIVVLVKQDSTVNGGSPEFIPHANRIVIDHGGGLYTRYLHLDTNSVVVQEGAHVIAGQTLGKSGNTGRSNVPHLRIVLCDVWGKSVAPRFAEIKDGVPVVKQRYTSRNEDASKIVAKPSPRKKPARSGDQDPIAENDGSAQPATSTLPENAFEFNAVELSTVLPAHLYDWDWTYVITGRVTNDATGVVFFLAKRDSDGCDTFFRAPVTAEHTFALAVRLADKADKLGQGTFKYAFATANADGTFKSAKMLPLVIVKK